MTADDRNIRCNMQNFPQQSPTQISQKQKMFSGFFIAYLECASNLEHLKKKMSILAQLFPKLLTPKELVT